MVEALSQTDKFLRTRETGEIQRSSVREVLLQAGAGGRRCDTGRPLSPVGNESREAAGYLMKDAGGVTDTCVHFLSRVCLGRSPDSGRSQGEQALGCKAWTRVSCPWLYSWPQLGGGEGLSRHICLQDRAESPMLNLLLNICKEPGTQGR